jgi:hypothetical protein
MLPVTRPGSSSRCTQAVCAGGTCVCGRNAMHFFLPVVDVAYHIVSFTQTPMTHGMREAATTCQTVSLGDHVSNQRQNTLVASCCQGRMQ